MDYDFDRTLRPPSWMARKVTAMASEMPTGWRTSKSSVHASLQRQTELQRLAHARHFAVRQAAQRLAGQPGLADRQDLLALHVGIDFEPVSPRRVDQDMEWDIAPLAADRHDNGVGVSGGVVAVIVLNDERGANTGLLGAPAGDQSICQISPRLGLGQDSGEVTVDHLALRRQVDLDVRCFGVHRQSLVKPLASRAPRPRGQLPPGSPGQAG